MIILMNILITILYRANDTFQILIFSVQTLTCISSVDMGRSLPIKFQFFQNQKLLALSGDRRLTEYDLSSGDLTTLTSDLEGCPNFLNVNAFTCLVAVATQEMTEGQNQGQKDHLVFLDFWQQQPSENSGIGL